MLTDTIGSTPVSGAQDTIPAIQKSQVDQDIARYRKMFDNARWQTNEARQKSQKDRDYFDGPKQLDSDVRRILELRKQPPIYTNRVRPAINGILGVLIDSKSDIRAYSREPDKDQEADVVTKTLRYVADVSHFDAVKIEAAENYLVEGIGACIVESSGQDVPVTQIRFEEFFYDPFSRRNDFKDARYLGIAKWMNAEDIKALYPDQYAAMGDPVMGMGGAVESTWNDRPENTLQWVDVRQRRVMVVECYFREGHEWMRVVYCWSGVFEHGVSPYRDDKGHSICPIEATSCYVDRDNRRYGVVRDMIPIQDEINASRSRSLHLMNARQLQQKDALAAPVDSETARMEAAKADGVLPPGWEIVSTAAQLQGNIERIQEAKNEIERMGPTPAILGRTGAETQSGRARQVLQQAGMTELARPLGRLDDWELRLYKQMWFRVKQFWTDQMFVRVTDDPKAPQYIHLNKPVQGMVPREAPVTDPWSGMPVTHPETGMPLTQIVPSIEITGYENQVSEMDMDLYLDVVPDQGNLEQETFRDLMDLAKQIPIDSPQFMIALELSPFLDKANVIERIKALMAQNQPPPEVQAQQQQEQQIVKQVALSQAQVDIDEKESKTQANLATAARTRAETATMLSGATDQAEGSDKNGIRF